MNDIELPADCKGISAGSRRGIWSAGRVGLRDTLPKSPLRSRGDAERSEAGG
jgi:hypothetical protein